MILRETTPLKVSRIGVMAAAILALLSLPSWSQVASDPRASTEPAAPRDDPAIVEPAEALPAAATDRAVADAPRGAREEARLRSLERRMEQLMAELRALKSERTTGASRWTDRDASTPDRDRLTDRGRRTPDRDRIPDSRGRRTQVAGGGGRDSGNDLQQIQGLWRRTTEAEGLFSKPRQTTKEVKGDTETVTYYDSEGNVLRAHTAKIRLGRAGPLKTFTFYDTTYTAGPKEGEKEEGEKSYVYKVVDDTFVEIWGVLEDSDSRVNALRWKREKPKDRTRR